MGSCATGAAPGIYLHATRRRSPQVSTDLSGSLGASLIDEAVSWGIRRHAASAVVTETVDQVLAAIPATAGDTRVLAVIREQTERISRG